ncbi:MAG: hypothetical protein AAFW60_12370 [Pseudomonadota bacterium]
MVNVAQNMVGPDFDTAETSPVFKTGTIIQGSDGHRYIYAQANGAIAAATRCILTDTDFQMAAGSGNWDSGPAMADNEYAWFRERTLEIAEAAA